MAKRSVDYKIKVLDEATKELKKVSKEMKQTGGAADKLAKKQKTLGASAKSLKSGYLVAAAAIAVMIKVASDAIKAYKKQEQAETKLRAALKATGNAVGISEKAMHSYAAELSKMTVISDEAIIEAQALMTTFTKVGKDVFPQAIEAAADMSAMFGQDLQQSVIQLGTALNDPIAGVGRLKRIGISFSADQKEQIKQFTEANDVMGAQKVILDELAAEFGGIAKAMAGTSTASMTQFSNAWGDLKEQMGRTIANAFQPTVNWLTTIVEKLTEAKKATNDLQEAKKKLAEGAVLSTEERDLILREKIERLETQLAQSTGGMGGGMSPLAAQLREEIDLRKRMLAELIAGAIGPDITGYIGTGEANTAALDERRREEQRMKQETFDAWFKPLLESADKYLEANKSLSEELRDLKGEYDRAEGNLDRALAGGNYTEEEIAGLTVVLDALGTQIVDLNSTIDEELAALGTRQDEANDGTGGRIGELKELAPDTGIFSQLAEVLGPVIQQFAGMIGSLSSVSQLLNWQSTILSGLMDVLGPVIDSILTPLVGILKIVGQWLGHILIPLFEKLRPAIEFIAKAFVWFYNKVMRPIGNVLITVGNLIYNAFVAVANVFIWFVNLFRSKKNKIAYISARPLDEGHMGEISIEDVNTAGEDAGTSTDAAAGATYTAGRNITVNVAIYTDVITGDGGIRDLALLIRNEITAAEALGY